MSEDDDLLDSNCHPPPRLVHPSGIEGKALLLVAAGEETVLFREGGDGGRVDSGEVEDGVEEDTRLGFANSRDGGEVMEATGIRAEEDTLDGGDESVPRIEALQGVEGGVLDGGRVGAVVDEKGCSQSVVGEGDGIVVGQEVGEVKDAFVDVAEVVDSGPPPGEALGEKAMAVTKGSELEQAGCSSLSVFSYSLSRAKEDLDGAWQVDAHPRDDVPVLVGCNKEVRINHPHRDASEEVEAGNVEGFGRKNVDVNLGEHGYPVALGNNEGVRTGHLQFEASEEVKIGKVEEFGGKNVGEHGESVPLVCNEEVRISELQGVASKEVEVGNMEGSGGNNVAGNVAELESVMLNDMDESLLGTSGSAPIVELEQEMDAYGSQQFKIPTVDDNVMSVDVFPHSDIKEEAADGVKMTESDIHDMGDSKLLGSSVALTPGEEQDAAALAPVSVPDEDIIVEDMAVVETKERSTSMSVRGGRKKRGRPPRTQTSKAQPKQKVEEDVCFICFDGGDLVVCDRRACPKVYHPSCVNRDEAFFRAKGRWNCASSLKLGAKKASKQSFSLQGNYTGDQRCQCGPLER